MLCIHRDLCFRHDVCSLNKVSPQIRYTPSCCAGQTCSRKWQYTVYIYFSYTISFFVKNPHLLLRPNAHDDLHSFRHFMCQIKYISHRILFEWWNWEEWDGEDTWHVWWRWEVNTGLWWRSEGKRPLKRRRRRWESKVKRHRKMRRGLD